MNGCLFFAETGHSLCEPFLSYWRGHGLQDTRLDAYGRSLALFGFPLSEPRMETNSSGDTVLTQWFERARFEDHGPRGVLLGLLGNETRSAPRLPPPPPVPGPSPTAACPEIPAPVDARIRPGTCLTFGDVMSMDIFGFAPGEEIAFWLTSPYQEVFGTEQVIPVGADGSLRGLEFPTDVLSAGMWFWVFQGRQSGHQSIIYFYVKQS
jgi:hypothetical protein